MKKIPIFLAGDTGSGKSSSFGKLVNPETGEVIHEGLPPEETFVINSEDQLLPAANAHEYPTIYLTTYKTVQYMLKALKSGDVKTINNASKKLIENQWKKEGKDISKITIDDIPIVRVPPKYVILDSWTATTEAIDRYTSVAFPGWDAWKQYNLIISELLGMIKALPQQVFVTGLVETKDIMLGNTKEYIKVKGKEHKFGGTEKEFQIVLFPRAVYDDTEDGELIGVKMQYKSNRKNTAKCPVGIFKEMPPNDALFIAKKVEEFVNGLDSKEEGTTGSAT